MKFRTHEEVVFQYILWKKNYRFTSLLENGRFYAKESIVLTLSEIPPVSEVNRV